MAIIRTGVSRIYLEVLGWYGQRSVGMSIKFFPECSLGDIQSEDRTQYGPSGCSSVDIFLILERASAAFYGKNLKLWVTGLLESWGLAQGFVLLFTPPGSVHLSWILLYRCDVGDQGQLHWDKKRCKCMWSQMALAESPGLFPEGRSRC